MKREEEFLSSIYEKRDAAVEKRRRTVRAARRAGIGFASLFFVAVISFAAFTRSADKEAMFPREDGADYMVQEAETSLETHSAYGESPSACGPEQYYNEKPPATQAVTSFSADPDTDKDGVCKEAEASSAAWTLAPGATGVDKRIVETVTADGEENEKKDFEKMLVLFGHSGESFGSHTEEYGGETVTVFRMFTSGGNMYFFRYNGNYCNVADPDPSFTAAEAIKLADDAINGIREQDRPR